MRFIFLTSVFDGSQITEHKAISPAANKWHSALLDALPLEPLDVVIGHTPEPMWPRGSFFPVPLNLYSLGWMTESVPYVNAPFLRNLSLRLSYFVKVTQALKLIRGDKLLFVTYNPPAWLQLLTKKLANKYEASWVSIVADGDAPIAADGLVFMSYGYYKSHPMRDSKKMHLDGALYKDAISADLQKKSSKTVLMYSGTSSKWGGVSYLLEAYSEVCQNFEVELWISGAGDYSQFSKQYSHEPSVKFFGMLSESELEERYKQADIFINPRPELYDNDKNFPSKLFDYLSYGKPVISFKTSGLSHQYNDLLIFPTENSVEALANSIEKVINWTDCERQFYASKLTHYASTVTWDSQAKRFLGFVESL
jgi:glycosyltransferase involved in cell wall biosynthesis